ncbi:CsgE family curli-type amyloid fiber assembly protein [Robertkochia sediminum]|uniref:CsgE family curli-type amyloid fiber assembly protein n=1 Tax=Robertkochia sediminum TaxID=2785326 RepID=UPI001933B046|nr:CsgE family curli-type amyloid fiber assembly protein [Robertkochia sediminum]MBL7471284.1 hypothetical protein [Robertkochia sediminum]
MRPYLFLSLFLLLSISLFSQDEVTGDLQAKIDMQSQGTFTKFLATAYNTTEINKSIRYEFVVVQPAAEGGNQNRLEQSGFQVLPSGIKKVLSEQTMVIAQDQRTIAFLILYQDDKVVGKDRVVINGRNGNDAQQPVVISKEALQQQQKEAQRNIQDVDQSNSDGITLRGMVVEDTKTKPGSDFYKEYYAQYLANNINGEQIVTIKEDLGMGSNTKIKVIIDQNVIMEFFVNPRATYIEQMAGQAIMRTNQYFRNLRKNKTLQKRY